MRFALILSVVCHTLSILQEDERKVFLEKLNNNQDDAIDDILLNFYKQKLKEAGLDYIKDDDTIEAIEVALVNSNGKRNRRDTNEDSMLRLSKWIDLLSDKKNGLLKVIGRRKQGDEIVKTVEFPHDRLCKAINTSKVERQEKREWKLQRRTEWMQFGIMTGIVTVIAFLWNSMMEEIRLVMHYLLIFDFSSVEKTCNSFKILVTKSDAEGFTTSVLMLLLLIVLPIQVYSISSKNKKWTLGALCLSVLSFVTITSCHLYYNNLNFSNKFIPFIELLTCILSFVFSIMFVYRLKDVKGYKDIRGIVSVSAWPTYGGIFLLMSYVFYELLTRMTFGINEPYESTPGVVIIPIAFSLFLWSILQMKVGTNKKGKSKFVFYWLFFVLSLSAIAIINYIPPYTDIKQRYGFTTICLLLLICIVSSSLIYLKTESRSKYFELTYAKRLLAIVSLNLCVISTFILNLGYNPLFISPSSVCHIASWRSIVVCEKDSLGNPKYLGLVNPLSGEMVIPCCIDITEEYDSLLRKGYYPFVSKGQFVVKSKVTFRQSPIEDNLNSDSTLMYDTCTHSITGFFATTSVLEDYLSNKKLSKIPYNSTLSDSIDAFAVQLFKDLRSGNLNYLLKGELYDLAQLPSLKTLDSLQYIAFKQEMKELCDSIAINKYITSKRATKEVLEDKFLVNMYKELTRNMLVSLIRDRVSHKDVSALFTLSKIYTLVYFYGIEGFGNPAHFNVSADQTQVKEVCIIGTDLRCGRLFAWYNLFDLICKMDNAFNSKSYSSREFIARLKGEYFYKIKSNTNKAISILSKEIRITNDTSYKKSMTKNLNGLREMNSFLDSISSIYSDIIYADNRLNEIKERTISSLIELSYSDSLYNNTVYNNAFESTIQNLILVSLMRGHDIQNDIVVLSKYRKDKNAYYDYVIKPTQNSDTEFNEINDFFNQIYNMQEELIESINKNINVHHEFSKILLDLIKLKER